MFLLYLISFASAAKIIIRKNSELTHVDGLTEYSLFKIIYTLKGEVSTSV